MPFTMKLFAALILGSCGLGCTATSVGSSDPHAAHVTSAATVMMVPVRVSGVVRGERFSFECAHLSGRRDPESTLIYSANGDIFVSCHDASLGISANTTIRRPSVGLQSDGRVAITIDGGAPDSRPDIVTTETSATSSSTSAGYVSISEWDATTQHLRGTSAMWWSRASGEKGEVKIEYDVSRRYSL